MLLALDTATCTGWAAGPVGAHPPQLLWGARNFGGTGKTTGEVLGTFRHWLQARCFELKPTLIVFESPYVPRPGERRPMNATTLRRLIGLVCEVEAVAWELRIECREATSGEFTKYLTGKGRWRDRDDKKRAVIEACRYHGWEVDGEDNAADALALWAYAESFKSPRAAEHRRRLAADRDRDLNGAGPLFPTLEIENGPRGKPRAARKPQPTKDPSLWPETAQV